MLVEMFALDHLRTVLDLPMMTFDQIQSQRTKLQGMTGFELQAILSMRRFLSECAMQPTYLF